MTQETKGKLGLLLVAIIWGVSFPMTAISIEYYSPYQTLALRFTLAAGTLGLILWPRLKKQLTRSLWVKGSQLGLALFLAFIFQTIGLQYTTASNNAFLTAANIVIVPFIAWLIKRERPSWTVLIGAIVTFIGIGCLSLDHTDFAINLGDGLTLICAVFFALQIFLTDEFVRGESPEILLFVQLLTAALCSWLTVIVMGDWQFATNWAGIGAIGYLGLLSTLLAYYLQTSCQRYTTSSQTAVILSLEAVFGMLASVIIIDEALTGMMLVGGILMFVGIVIVERKNV